MHKLRITLERELALKTSRSHQMWATDASYFRVLGWDYCYMVTVMDDYSQFILAWKLQWDMTFKTGVAAFNARTSEFHNGFQEYVGSSSFTSFRSDAPSPVPQYPAWRDAPLKYSSG